MHEISSGSHVENAVQLLQVGLRHDFNVCSVFQEQNRTAEPNQSLAVVVATVTKDTMEA